MLLTDEGVRIFDWAHKLRSSLKKFESKLRHCKLHASFSSVRLRQSFCLRCIEHSSLLPESRRVYVLGFFCATSRPRFAISSGAMLVLKST